MGNHPTFSHPTGSGLVIRRLEGTTTRTTSPARRNGIRLRRSLSPRQQRPQHQRQPMRLRLLPRQPHSSSVPPPPPPPLRTPPWSCPALLWSTLFLPLVSPRHALGSCHTLPRPTPLPRPLLLSSRLVLPAHSLKGGLRASNRDRTGSITLTTSTEPPRGSDRRDLPCATGQEWETTTTPPPRPPRPLRPPLRHR